MEQEFSIDKTSVFNEIHNQTGAVAKQIDGSHDKIATTDDEAAILSNFMDQAINDLCGQLEMFTPIIADNSKIKLILPPTFKTKSAPTINKILNSYIAMSVCGRWFGLSSPAHATQYAEKSANIIGDLIKMICSRNKPQSR